ncbi:MAG: hydrogenase maturation nickel metallochaperone HypA [Deltaproteobacteria bacterium]|nr:MAG: hydrogenase maturation nickel metallochaperone HypA [Deltaproteobacteria bacterium]
MSIVDSLIKIILEEWKRQGEKGRVSRINIQVGKLTAIIPRTFQFCFNILAKDTVLENAQLEIAEVPVKVKCSQCNSVREIDEPVFVCPECGEKALEIVSGRELFIESFELV